MSLFEITEQGNPVVNCVIEDNCKVRILAVDLKTKYCEVSYKGVDPAGIPCIGICVSARTLKAAGLPDLDIDTALGNTRITEISFPELKGFIIYSAEINRYTLNICFRENLDVHLTEFTDIK